MEKKFEELLKEGVAALEAGNASRALELLQEAADQDETPEVLSNMALCLAKVKQDFARAETLCREALEYDPGNSIHYLNLGRVLVLNDRKQEAIRVFRDGLLRENNPKLRQELQRLGTRKYPVIASLPREHALNRFLGKFLKSIRLR